MALPVLMKIVLDGNDGTGKSTLARKLQELGFTDVKDRGIPTKMTDDPKLRPGPEHEDEDIRPVSYSARTARTPAISSVIWLMVLVIHRSGVA